MEDLREGRLAEVGLPELLTRLANRATSAEVRLSTDFGPGTIWLTQGQLVDAVIDSESGEEALFRLLGLTDGWFKVEAWEGQRKRTIEQSLEQLLGRRSDRIARWTQLVEQLPPLSAVLVADLEGLASIQGPRSGSYWDLLRLVDGRRAIIEIIEDSGRDAVEALQALKSLLDEGLLELDRDAPLSGPASSVAGGAQSEGPASAPISVGTRGPSGVLPLPDDVDSQEVEPVSEAPPSTQRLSQPAPPRQGPTLGRYEVLSHLGRGGVGTVYLGRVTGEGGFRRHVAIKVLRSHLSRSSAAYEMLAKEARIASRVQHPNVVQVIDFGSHRDQPYLVMDYVQGCSLAELLRVRSESASAAAGVSIVLDALSGLQATHALRDEDGRALRVVHHDVSPHNILVGADGTARLSDFGVAQIQQSVEDGHEQQRHGKPGFTAPERVNGAAGDCRSDIFSIGVVLWTALTGESLFNGKDPETVLESVLTQPIPPPSQRGRSPESLDEICLRALQRNPDRRYQTAEDMLVQLRRVAVAEDLLPPPSVVADWVVDVMGRQVDLGRLEFLDANRAAREREAGQPSSAPDSRVDAVPGSEDTHTVSLREAGLPRRGSPWKLVAVVVGVLLLVAAFLVPRGEARRPVLPRSATPAASPSPATTQAQPLRAPSRPPSRSPDDAPAAAADGAAAQPAK